MTADNKELTEFRREIDVIDDKIVALLAERTNIVTKVGRLKHKENPGQCPIRPGREAEMVRRIIDKCKDTNIPPAAGAAIWRLFIGMSTAVEAKLNISVFAAERDESLVWLAREYFGPTISVSKQPHIKRVIGDVMDGKASVGIVPPLRSSDAEQWWPSLMQQGKESPKVFAHLPFVNADGKDAHTALAIARITPEASGEDVSLLAIEADHNVSQHKLQTALAQNKLEASWINIATLNPATRHHLVACTGFVMPAHASLHAALLSLGTSILGITFLGAYAAPLILNPSKKELPHAPHA